MNIVYFIDHLRPDGTQRVLQQLVEGLRLRRHSQTIICLNNSWDAMVIAGFRKSGAKVYVLGKGAMLGGYGIIALLSFLRRQHYDVAVTLLFYSDVVGRTLSHFAGIPHIVTSIRARNTNYTNWQRYLVKKTMHWANTIILNSAAVRDFAIEIEGACPERITVIPNGVCVEDYYMAQIRANLIAEFGLVSGRYIIGSVGRLTYQKGFDILIAALGCLHVDEVELLLVGVGEEEVNLRAQAVALGLDKRVHFAGYRRDVPQLLGALDVYVHPARFEGMPNALLEAMAAGCPIVASEVDGNRELIEDGFSGWLVSPEDVSSLAKALDTALSNFTEARRRGDRARQRAISQFSVAKMIEKWEVALINEVI